MKTERVKISQIKTNSANPRTISDGKFTKLVNSILVLPKMLEIRPIVVDSTMVVLGGNMRYRALSAIAGMTEADIRARLSNNKDFQAKTQGEKDALVNYWLVWLDNPTTDIIKASELSDAEKREFIIKDNVGFGDWDYDALANEWNSDELNNWGVDVWSEDDLWDDSPEEEVEGNDTGLSDDEEAEEEGNEDFSERMVNDVLYETDNEFEIPCLRLDMQAGKVELPLCPWGANSRLRKDVTTYHFYVDDYRFEKLWKDPVDLINSGCKAIVEPNCSTHDQTPVAYGLQLIYKKRWLARYMQDLGVKVYVDLNVAPKFREYNKMGVPKGYNAFFTRGCIGWEASLDLDLQTAREISGKENPNLIVYGGGKTIQEWCRKNSILYIQDFINDKDRFGNGEK